MGKIVIPSGDFHIGNRGSLMTHEVIVSELEMIYREIISIWLRGAE